MNAKLISILGLLAIPAFAGTAAAPVAAETAPAARTTPVAKAQPAVKASPAREVKVKDTRAKTTPAKGRHSLKT